MCGASIFDTSSPLDDLWNMINLSYTGVLNHHVDAYKVSTHGFPFLILLLFLYYHTYPSATATPSLCRCRHPRRTAHLCHSSSPSSNPNRRGKLGPIIPAAGFSPVVSHHPFRGNPPSRSPPLQSPPPPGQPQSETPSAF